MKLFMGKGGIPIVVGITDAKRLGYVTLCIIAYRDTSSLLRQSNKSH
ncbi:hypothetical protein IM45_1248 [Candidatus Palibaumannia cicadellinicola]|uniref:Uncharacterized protein n=1 Tax=Candidatus Palibaumannia cicadellinicola TaxID=186490 RepID=A0A088NBG7_9GAMM|nr:hypothetical protein IM45_1248 [Candidatus Baumannia cicadellinicola]